MTRLALAYFFVLVALLAMADFGLMRSAGAFVDRYPSLDKVIHFAMYGVLALLANAALSRQRGWSVMRAVATGSLIVVIGSTVEEYSNLLVASRNWSLGDLAANYLGVVCLGMLPFSVWRQPAVE